MKMNYYWIKFIDLNGIEDKSVVPGKNKADAIVSFKNSHPGYKTLGAKLVPGK